MPQTRSPVCEWCKQPIAPDELEMGEVEIVREVHRERRSPWGPFTSETQWEEKDTEKVRERRPFHRDCLQEYQQQNRSGVTLGAALTLLALVVIALAVLYLLAVSAR